jgi:hypothetical protein
MAPLTPRNRHPVTPLAALLVLLALAPSDPAQAPPAARTFYAAKAKFSIPFEIDPGEGRIREVQLYAQKAGGRWEQVATARPGDHSFPFTAWEDGWYSFTVRTIDQQGQGYPATLDQAEPRMRVCVDTHPPAVSLRPATSPDGPAAVEWEVRDDNLDTESLRLDYRVAGTAEWQLLAIQKAATGHRAWNPATNGTLEVRLTAKDLAGNAGEGTATVTPGAAARPAGATATADPGAGGVAVRVVNSKRISINYELKEVGKSGVAVVELWYTRSDGRNWQKYDERVNPQSPYVYVVEVNDEGLYGFTLVARNRAGFGEQPPKVGDTPQVWVEVDLTKPVVHLQGVEVGRGQEAGNLTISYTAADKNLAPQPISLSWAEKPEGPWVPIAANEENTGRYVWRMPETVPYQFYVRVEAADRAGNVGGDETHKPVIVDLSQPKVQVIGISPAGSP